MGSPKISVIIPTYNGADYLGEAIQSVLDQTYPHFEVIIVDDASPQNTVDLVKQLNDPHVKFLRHESNRGAVAARHTGTCSSSGDIIAYLDQDDLFHKEKLQTHVDFLQNHPEIGATYNARFEIKDSIKTISGLWRPPKIITLADFVLGYPISPSDTVLRREWALRDEIWDDSFASEAEHVIFNGHEIVFGGRLALAGCQFRNVGRTLNYRRFHSQRTLKHLADRCKSEHACQEMVFKDPRCPPEVLALQNVATANIYLVWAYFAYIQEEIGLGQQFLNRAVELKPSLLDGKPCELVKTWAAWAAINAEHFGRGHEAIIDLIFDNFPPELQGLKREHDWAITTGYLWKGMHTMIWGTPKDARASLAQARQLGAVIDSFSAQIFVDELSNYQAEFGSQASQAILRDFILCWKESGNRRSMRELKGCYWVNQAFSSYSAGEYGRVPRSVLQGIFTDPKFLFNRGVISILFRSLTGNTLAKFSHKSS
jgi:glycosyltransferase involved in cell wall biosynthesis